MSMLTSIKYKIKELGPAEFQEFCDALLEKMHPDWNIHELGMQAGRSKTTIGNPDTYFRLPSGKYCFVAYTNQETGKLVDKIQDDIDKCLDETKTGLPIEFIDNIIVCHTSSNLKAGDDKKLHDRCENLATKDGAHIFIPLTIMGIDELANCVYNKYRSLAVDILHLPMGTGQIIDVDEFIRIYDSAELAAPLDTPFLFRDRELKEILASVENNTITVISGKAGVGKTRLAIEACKQFAGEKGFKLLCMKSKELPIYDDFIRTVEDPGDYVLFIDDANNFENLGSIIDHVESARDVYHFRIVMTVRDYVREGVANLIGSHNSTYQLIPIDRFSDEKITSFLKNVLNITDDHYVDRIIQIAEGNPRIAYMAGKMIETSAFDSIKDSTQLLDEYYKQFIDGTIGQKKDLCLTAGILAVIRAVVESQTEFLDDIFKEGGISESQFKSGLDELVEAEYAEKRNGVYTFSDQCLSNYMLYYVFIKKKLVPFSRLLDVGFRHFKEGVVESSSTIVNIFNNESSVNYLNEQIRIVWKEYAKGSDVNLFHDFLEVYHTANPEDGFLIAKNEIDSIPVEQISGWVDFSKNWYSGTSFALKMLSGYTKAKLYSDMALALAIQYASKSATNFLEFYHWFCNEFNIDQDAYLYNYTIQIDAIKALKKHALDYPQFSDLCLNIAAKWLSVEYNPVSLYRHGVIRSYHIEFKYSKEFSDYRKSLFSLILKVEENYLGDVWNGRIREDILILLDQYISYIRGGMEESIIKDEANEFEQVVNYLHDDLTKAIRVYKLQRICSYMKIELPWNFSAKDLFSLPEWHTYQLLKKDEAEAFYSGLDYKEYDRLYENRIKDLATKIKADDIYQFIKQVVQCIEVEGLGSHSPDPGFSFKRGVAILGEQISDDHELAISLIRAIQKYGKNIDVSLDSIFKNEIERDYKGFYKLISNSDYASVEQKNKWQYYYFALLPDECCDSWTLKELLDFLRDDSDKHIRLCGNRNMGIFLKFLKCDENIISKTAQIILDKAKYSRFMAGIYLDTLFEDRLAPEFSAVGLLDLFKNDVDLLKMIYAFEIKYGMAADHDGSYLYNFCMRDSSWADIYCEYLYSLGMNVYPKMPEERGRLIALWKLDDAEEIFDKIFKSRIVDTDLAQKYVNRYTLKILVKCLSGEKSVEKKIHDWMVHLVDTYANTDIIRTVFAISVNLKAQTRKDMFAEFLTLNHKPEIFESLPFEDDTVEGSPSLVPAYERQKSFIESLLELTQDVTLLPQRKILLDKIKEKERTIELHKTQDIIRSAYY